MICSSPAYSRKKIWKHWNACVFDGARPNIMLVLQIIANECFLWCSADAKRLQELLISLGLGAADLALW
jgi:hypothetical protein